MKLLIKMKPNFAVRNSIYLGDNYIIVSNHDDFNEVINSGFVTKKFGGKRTFKSRIGRWNIKYKELKSK